MSVEGVSAWSINTQLCYVTMIQHSTLPNLIFSEMLLKSVKEIDLTCMHIPGRSWYKLDIMTFVTAYAAKSDASMCFNEAQANSYSFNYLCTLISVQRQQNSLIMNNKQC